MVEKTISTAILAVLISLKSKSQILPLKVSLLIYHTLSGIGITFRCNCLYSYVELGNLSVKQVYYCWTKKSITSKQSDYKVL
jgi:hypothetical protein